ncbi:MAG: DNRLRE domain-containing protein [Candidatus Auribacterota bacterium]|jgi:hypothetical protein|nr:DNRLRE domain-containing protein [Candidatus Auribacterota bacterium]
MKPAVCLLTCLIIACASQAIAVSVVIQPDESGKDIIIRSYLPAESFDSTWLYVRNDDTDDLYRTMIEFDLSSISVQSVDQAILQLYCYHQEVSASPTIYANRITNQWEENTVNWISHGTSYTTDGSVSQSGTAGIGWVSWDVTDIVNDWLNTSNGIQNYGFMLTGNNIQPNNRTFFYSSDYLADTSLRPKLSLEYTEPPAPPAVPEPVSAMLIIAGITGLIIRKKR